MITNLQDSNEICSAEAFTRQSAIFDDIYSANAIIQYKRERVRAHVNKYLHPGSKILELNSGTGEDAVYFAKQLNSVHATDISAGMLKELVIKVKKNNLEKYITSENCSYTQLTSLRNKGPFDLIFSNFAGLNCTDQLQQVLESFSELVSSGGIVTLVIMPGFCLWEILMLFKRKFKTAFRRLNSKYGANAHVEGVHFKCWYYQPSFIINTLKDNFEVLNVEGLCTIVPPSYIEHFAEKYPRLFSWLKRLEERLKNQWPWRCIGDYYIITLRKK